MSRKVTKGELIELIYGLVEDRMDHDRYKVSYRINNRDCALQINIKLDEAKKLSEKE